MQTVVNEIVQLVGYAFILLVVLLVVFSSFGRNIDLINLVVMAGVGGLVIYMGIKGGFTPPKEVAGSKF